MTTAALSQSQFRIRTDTNAVNTSPTWLAAVNTNGTIVCDTTFRVRFTIQETGGGNPAAHTVKLQAANGAGSYQDVTTSSTIVKAIDAGSSADEAATTQLMTGTGTFVGGRYDETGSVSTSVDIGSSGNTEYEFGLQINGADVASGDTIHLKVVALSGTSITATQIPAILTKKLYTLALAAGSYSLSGVALATRYYKPALVAGSYSLSGTAPALSRGRPLALTAGAYAWSIADTITINGGVSLDAGSYSLSGVAANLSYHPASTTYTLALAHGSYAWSIADTVTIDGGVGIGAGSYSLGGVAAGLTYTPFVATYTAHLGAGSYLWSIADTITINGGVSLAAGSYSLSGVAATLTRSQRVLVAAAGSYLTTGGPGVRDYELVINPGSYSLSGVAAALKATRTITASAGSYTLTGKAADLNPSTSHTLALGAGSYTWHIADVITRDGGVGLGAGSYVLEGLAAILLSTSRRVALDAGSYAVSGSAAEFIQARRRSLGILDGGRTRRRVDLSKIKAGFSRRYYDEMVAAEKAATAALKAAAIRKRVEQKEALERAARAAQEALARVEEDDTEVDLTRLTRALDAAVSAKNFATSLKRAKDAIDAANAIMDEEEEEAIMLLLMHT